MSFKSGFVSRQRVAV